MRIVVLIIMATTLICSCSKKAQGLVGANVTKEDMAEEAKRYKDLADGICDCSKGLIVMLKEIQSMGNENKEEQYKDLKKKFDNEAKESETCIQELEKENSKEEALDEVLVENALKEYCTDFYNMLKIGRIR